MKVLIIMHDAAEGPGTLEDYLGTAGAEMVLARLYAGDRLPDPSEVDAAVSLGGPMNVYEENLYPFLMEETDFLARAVRRDLPVLGVCLGAQMIAKACGAAVTRAPVKEAGFGEVALTAAGRKDAAFAGLPEKLRVFHWHEDTFAIPAGGTLLASSPECAHQAFRVRNALGLQFHVEITPAMLEDWFLYSREKYHYINRFKEIEMDLVFEAQRIFYNFFSGAKGERPRNFEGLPERFKKTDVIITSDKGKSS